MAIFLNDACQIQCMVCHVHILGYAAWDLIAVAIAVS